MMPGHLSTHDVLAFVERHGYALLFWWVLAEQSALPLPSVPLLIAAGALIRAGRLHPLLAIAWSILATLIADTVWFELGRRRGRQVLRLLCRISLEPDSCVRQTENAFLKYGMSSLLVSKFLPGLNTIAAPLAGNSRRSYGRFLAYDSAGALIWSGSYLALGYLFSEQLETIVARVSRMGANLLLLAFALLACWIGWKFLDRRRFLRQLQVARITPAELGNRLSAGEDLLIIDLRSELAGQPDLIPGALRISPEELAADPDRIPRDHEIVLFCS
jgi:membrane protein DedA with SNARE-associated domain